MGRIRCLVNAEFIAEDANGKEQIIQWGAGTYLEADKVEVYGYQGDTYANIHLKNGLILHGVTWETSIFENHGVLEENLGNKDVDTGTVRSETEQDVSEPEDDDSGIRN